MWCALLTKSFVCEFSNPVSFLKSCAAASNATNECNAAPISAYIITSGAPIAAICATIFFAISNASPINPGI